MGRFTRRQRRDLDWVQQLPDPFAMRDVLDVVPADTMARALTWLYDAIERGRIDPQQTRFGMRYAFIGDRRGDDGELADVVPFPRHKAV